MPGYMRPDGSGYYEGDRQPGDIDAPERPSTAHELVEGVWRLPPDLYQRQRAREYPPIGDQLDALWKSFEPPAGSEAAAIKAQIAAIKQRYPKP